MEFFGFVLVHTVKKEDSEKCKTLEGLQTVELTNVANYITAEPTVLEHFISQRGIDEVAISHAETGVDLYVECLTLRNEVGTSVFTEGEHAGKPVSQLLDEGVVHLVDHTAIVVELP